MVGRADELFARIQGGGAAEIHNMIAAPIEARPDADCRFAISGGSNGGPGSAKELVFPAPLMTDAYAYYTRPPIDLPTRRAGDDRYEYLIKQRL
jgi:hypothetical protein